MENLVNVTLSINEVLNFVLHEFLNSAKWPTLLTSVLEVKLHKNTVDTQLSKAVIKITVYFFLFLKVLS